MKSYTKKGWRQLLSLCLSTCLLCQCCLYPVVANDRSADIIGSSPLLVPRLLTSAGLSGRGQIIGLADSGLDKGSLSDIHSDLLSETGTIPRVVMLKSYTDRGRADDPNGHGTFMAGTIVGSGQASQGQFQGVAPGASLYFQALLDKNGNLRIPTNINDLFIPAHDAGVRIHVDGWGNGKNIYGSEAAQIDKFVYYYPDFLPVFAAGNGGSGSGTLTAQANSKNALVIGSSQVPRPAFDPESRYADQVAESSSQGPTGDGRIKPDLLAPGSALISACSSLVESNFAANSAYTRMGGSSMAAAVAGGGLALLREQLTTRLYIPDPSAALMRAALINGARSLPADISHSQGFGIMDLAGTALALRERTFKVRDEKTKLLEGQSLEYKLQVTDPSLPVKITLAWTDPPGDPGAASSLVNNLDLVVLDPSGKDYLGNDFNSMDKVDNRNNVEQVAIQLPKAGEYTIKVRAARIGAEVGQDFALAYGQTLKTGIVKKVDNNLVQLMDGTTVDLNHDTLYQVKDGVLEKSTTEIQPGSQTYTGSDAAYIFGQTWHTGGIQSLPTEAGDLLLEINSTSRQGGYYLDPRAAALNGAITVNGRAVGGISDIPSGSELIATVNPVLQNLWRLAAANQQITGYVEAVDQTARAIKLAGENNAYKLAPWAAITNRDAMLDCSPLNIPYSGAPANELGRIVPGTRITMEISPQIKTVQSIILDRSMAVGQVVFVDLSASRVTLDTGRSYYSEPAGNVTRDRKQVALEDIQTGDLVIAQLNPENFAVMDLQTFSQVSYGRIVYASSQQKSLYLIDTNNRSQSYLFDKQTVLVGGGIQLESTSLASGSWVRVIGDPNGNRAWWVDRAEIVEERTKTLAAVDAGNNTLRMTDGSRYSYSPSTRISKGGFSIDAADLVVGEQAFITTLAAPAPWPQQLAGVEVKVRVDIDAPNLRLTANALNGVLVIQGYTNGDRLYLYRKDGSYVRMEVTDGLITGLFGLLDDETELRAMVIDKTTGGMKSLDIKISTFNSEPAVVSFRDTVGHWAEQAIMALAQRNIVQGFGNGSFHPDQNLSRGELAVILARLQNLNPAKMPDPTIFSDYYDIPWWALEPVLACREAGLIIGSPDGYYYPNRAVTRQEMELIAAQLTKQSSLNLFPETPYQPNLPITRGQAAAILNQL